MAALNELPLRRVSDMIASGEIRPSELLEDCLARIQERDSEVRAFTHLDSNVAITKVKQLDDMEAIGSLHGIPFGVKDIINTSDMPTTMGSPIYLNHTPSRDASCVSVLRNAGAVIPGKTESTEFAYFYPGKTRNPHSLAHTPGGSSMGSAAAVADNMLPVAIGSQTAASVIRPAAFCGVVGYKASHELFSLEGVCGLAQSLDSLGFFVRDIRDLPLIRSGFHGSPKSIENLDCPPRIGLVHTPHWEQANSDQREAIEDTCNKLANESCTVAEVEIGPSDGALTEAQITVMAFEASRSLAGEYDQFPHMLSQQIKELIELGQETTFEEYRRARSLADNWQRNLVTVFEKFDVLMTPGAIGEAPMGLDATGDPLFCRMWTLLKVPSISLPAGVGMNGLPLGVQLIGPYNADDALISIATWINDRL